MKRSARIEQPSDVEIQSLDDDRDEERDFGDSELVRIDWLREDNSFDESRMRSYRFAHRFPGVLVEFRLIFVVFFAFALSRLVLALVLILILALITVALLILASAPLLLLVLSGLFGNDKMRMLDDALDDVVVGLLAMIASFNFLDDNFDVSGSGALLRRFDEI